jgi:hypothetical protein
MSQVRAGSRGFPLLSGVLLVMAAGGVVALGGPSGALGAIAAHSVAWPPSRDLVIGEIVTGGERASDEYVEIYNGGSVPADLGGLELVYSTASGASVTRKATWTSAVLEPGRHELVANRDGAFGGLADDVYAGGLASTGGAVALRVVGGAVLDSVGWGTAAGELVEGSPGLAPPAGQSLERLPGGAAGNGQDANDNASDTRIQAFPIPEGRTSPPVPSPGGSPAPSAPASPRATAGSGQTSRPLPTDVPSPTDTPHATDTPLPTRRPLATDRPPTPLPSLLLSPAPTPAATSSHAPTPSASPPAVVLPVSAARNAPIDSVVTVVGTISVEPGRILGDGEVAIQDRTGGICLRLPPDVDASTPVRGRIVEVTGQLAAPWGNLEIRIGSMRDLVDLGGGGPVEARTGTSADLGEPREGQLLRLTGSVARIESGSTGSVALTLADTAGEARIFVFAGAGVGRGRFAIGARIAATGVVGQRESARGLGDGYRLWPRDGDDLALLASAPTPTPGSGPTSRPSFARPTATPRSTPAQAARPTARPKPSAPPDRARLRIAGALLRGGDSVTVEGTVTTSAGLLDADGRRFTIQDSSGAILVRLPGGSAAPPMGTRISVTGLVGTYYGAPQLEASADARSLGRAAAAPILLHRAPAASDEWRLVRVTVRVTDMSTAGDTWRAEASTGAGGSLPISGLAASRIPSTTLSPGDSATVTGVVRRAYPTAADQRFSLVPRNPSDIDVARDVSRAPGPDGTGSLPQPARTAVQSGGAVPAAPADGQAPATLLDTAIAALPTLIGQRVRVAGTVSLVDGPLATIGDGTGQVVVRAPGPLDSGDDPIVPGELLNAVGYVSERDVGGLEIVVTDLADLTRAPALTAEPGLIETPGAFAVPDATFGIAPPPEVSDAAGGAPLLVSLFAGLMVGGAVASGGVLAILRRRRRMAAAARLHGRTGPDSAAGAQGQPPPG